MSRPPADGPPSPGGASPDDAASAPDRIPARHASSAPDPGSAPDAVPASSQLSPRLGPAAAIAAATGFVVYAVLDFSGSGSTTAARLLVLASVLCVLAGRVLWFGDDRSPNV